MIDHTGSELQRNSHYGLGASHRYRDRFKLARIRDMLKSKEKSVRLSLRSARFMVAVLILLCGGAAVGQNYPLRPIRVIVPYPPGGSPDVLTRGFGERLQASLGQPVVVENKPGAGTLLAAEYVAKSPPDGYTMMLATSTAFGISPNVSSTWSVDPVKDFTFLGLIGWSDFFLVVNPAFPANNLKDLINLVQKDPGKFNYASVGIGTTHHLFMEILKSVVHLDIVHVPYKGSVAALPDLMTDKVQMMFLDYSVAVPNIRAGKLKAIGTSRAAQNTLFASIVPIASTIPDYDWAGWQGIAGPAAVPRPIVIRVADVIRNYQSSREYLDLMNTTGMVPSKPMSQEELSGFLKAEFQRWGAAIKASGAKFE